MSDGMLVIADLHLHSKYARATSKEMDLKGIAKGAKLKGLNVVGTGDFTHPTWLEELKDKLKPLGNGLFEYDNVYFLLSCEVATHFEYEGKERKVHHVIHAPSFEIVDQINESLSPYGNLKVDGRPVLSLSAPELVEMLLEISNDIVIYPAHAWTPWYGILGSKSGFDSIRECYQDQTKHIFAIETGLSSDPPMNWRLSSLDDFTLVSNSDSHSPWPWRLGREANVFELKEMSYKEIFDAIRKKDKKKFLYTIEVPPSYGKYHFDGHRKCNVRLSPTEAQKFNNVCPKCGKKLTIGVLHRVEELADRPEGFVPKDYIPFKSIIPLYEVISHVLGVKQLYSQKVMKEHDKLIEKFGSELNILLNVPEDELRKVTSEKIVSAIIKMRKGKVKFIPGYDGVYGIPVFEEDKEEESLSFCSQKSLLDFEK